MSKEFGHIPLTWTRIGEYREGVGIYLCDQFVEKLPFDQKSNEWDGSDIQRWLNCEFYQGCFSEGQRSEIVPSEEAKSNIFLLSAKEYIDFRRIIPVIEENWWLRSPGFDTNAAVVITGGDLDIFGGGVYDSYGVRPAILMSE